MAQSFDKIVSSLFFKFQQKDCLPTMIRLFKQSFYDFFSKNKKESKKFSSYPNAGCFDEQIEYDYSPLHKCWPNTSRAEKQGNHTVQKSIVISNKFPKTFASILSSYVIDAY